MKCRDVDIFVSAVHDGEDVPLNAAQHIAGCEECRAKLQAYSEIAAELRLSVSLHKAPARPSKPLPETRSRGLRPAGILWQRISVPRYAVWSLVCLLALAVVTIPLVRAQSKPMWFLFGLTVNEHEAPLRWTPARDGYNDEQVLTYGGPVNAIAVRLAVKHVAENTVSLQVKARQYADFNDAQKDKLSLEGAAVVTYAPGQSIAIAVEGGGTVHLTGRIEDHQPKIAWGQPLELDADQFIVRSPVLVSDNEKIFELNGATAIAQAGHECVWLGAGANGRFLFALQPFPGAVEGQVNWGELTFTMDGSPYKLVSPAPMTGGDQPRKVWVRREVSIGGPAFAIGSLPLPN